MAYINLNSKPTISASCDMFTIPPTQRSCEQGYYNVYRPISNYESEDSPIEFIVTGNSEYIDLGHTTLRLRVKMLQSNGEAINADSKVGPINNFIHSMFSSIHIELNNMCVTQSSGLYNYRCIIENLLNYGYDARTTHLRSSMFYKDTSGTMNGDEHNAGHSVRRAYAGFGEFDLESHIHSDIFNQNKLLLSNVPIVIKLYKAKSDFALMAPTAETGKFQIKITDAQLIVRKVKVASAIAIAHEAALLRTPARYFITRVEVKHFTIPKDLMSHSIPNLFLGQLPKRIIIGFVDQEAFNGSITTNPFNFEHFDHCFLDVKTDASITVDPLEPNFAKGLYMQSYNSLFYSTGINFKDCGNSITHMEFARGYCLSCFDLTPDLSSSESYLSPNLSGNLGLNIKFAKTLPKPVSLIVYSEFQNMIEIDRFRTVTTDFKR